MENFPFLKNFHRFLLSNFCLFYFTSYSQLPVLRYDSIPVIEGTDTLKNAWAGGINSALFSEIDLNSDGIKDLFIFEKMGNIIKTFINDGSEYHYAPLYQQAFPKMELFALLADYNCDGKEDIFCYAPGGMAVYKNQGALNFSLVTSLLKCDYGSSGYANIFASALDLPAFADVDNDGDLDILNFDLNGGWMQFYRNLSMDSLSTCDSLGFPFYYRLENKCWGNFFELINTNFANFPLSCKTSPNPDTVFSCSCFSTILAIDMDGDSDKDLIIGGNSGKNMDMLTNGGSISTAQITAQELVFPANSTAVNIAFPAGFFMDVNNDNIKDLLVTTNAPNSAEDINSVWFYRNSGTNNSPVFNFEKNNFLQETMIDLGSGNNPVFFDYNSDGLTDLVVGNYGYYNSGTGLYDGKLALFENTGNANNPRFSLITRDYMNISAEKINALYPIFGDLDNDGDEDMLIGEYDGKIHFYENTAGAGNTANFILKDAKYKNIDVGHFAAPQIIDVNRDGLLDLLVGEQDGTLNYFENIGTQVNADFISTPTIDTLGGIDVMIPCCTGYSAPFLFESSSGNYSLLVGSEEGIIYYYTNIDGNLNGNFTLSDSIETGEFRTSISMAEINNNGKLEIAVGSYPGGMHILKTDFIIGGNEIFSKNNLPDFEIYPNPNDGKFNLKISIPLNSGMKFEKLKIYNVLGELVYSKTLTTNNEQLTTNFPSGIYFLQIFSEGNPCIRKMVKM